MTKYELRELLERQRASGRPYLEFLRVPALSMGIYRLPAGGTDHQVPHAEDEVYYVLEGRCRFRVGDEDTGVEPGQFFFVPAGLPHRFYDVTADLMLLVFFAPAESPGPLPAP